MKANRHCLAVIVLAILPTSCAAPRPVGPDERSFSGRPNIVFILIDDLGWSDLGCTGSRFYETPNIDRLAGQGMRFTDAYAAAPICSPTRASILTGKYPARLHLTEVIREGLGDRPTHRLLGAKYLRSLPPGETTLPKALKPLGYVSACIGKWHLGGEGSLPGDHGFDLSLGGADVGTAPGGYFKFETPTLKLRDGEYLTDRLTEEAERFMEGHKDNPFFLYLAHYAVHTPFQAKSNLIAKYKAKAKPYQDQNHPVYAAMIESADESVGRILKKLEELKIADRTIVFFTSDNGGMSFNSGTTEPATSNCPLRSGKGSLYEGGIRVPLIVRWPGVTPPGGISEVPVSSVDFYPTILEAAGGTLQSEQIVDGISLAPLLRDQGGLRREAIYWHYPHGGGGRPSWFSPCGAVRKGDFKLIEFYEEGRLELYDLRESVAERHDLAGVKRDKASELRRLLQAWLREADAQMPTPNPEYRLPAPTTLPTKVR